MELSRPNVEERVTRGIGRSDGVLESLCVERRPEGIGVQYVESPVAQERGHRGHPIDDPTDRGTNSIARGRVMHRLPEVGGPNEIVEMPSLDLVELERASDAVEDFGRRATDVAAFESGVVLDADIGQEG